MWRMPASYSSAFPIVYTEDLPAALRFYRDLLGFAVNYEFPEDGEPVFVGMDLAGCELALADIGDAEAAAIHGRPLRPVSGHRFELCVYADDVDGAVEELRAAGVTVLAEPADQPWGERLAYVEDPDGNPVMITAPNRPADASGPRPAG
jgi:lactoylglutathione lyase